MMKVKYKKSGENGKKPSASAMADGEIAVNYNTTNPRIMIKDSKNTIVSFLPESNINSKFNTVQKSVNTTNTNVNTNKTDIETLQTWVDTPATADEIRALLGGVISFELLSGMKGWYEEYNGTYQAEKGMTWAQWCNSKYNTIKAHVVDDFVGVNYDEFMDICKCYIGDIDNYISPNDIIKNNKIYLLME
jgi:hypothetical protein